MGAWSSSMSLLVLIAGVVVALQAAHVLSISIAFHTITQDFKNSRSVAGIAVGIGVSVLAAVPGSKNRGIERRHVIPAYRIDRAKLWRTAAHLGVIARSMAKHSDLT